MIKPIDRTTKQNLVLLVYKTLPEMNYPQMHKVVMEFQNRFIEKHGYSLGYTFCDPSIYKCWDNQLQEDLERYEADQLVKTENPKPTGCSCDNSLTITKNGRFILDTAGKCNLETMFYKGVMKELADELLEIKEKIEG
jgi:hypothetical protein